MFFEQLSKNSWRCIGEGPRHPITGKRQQFTRRGKTKSEAKKRVEEAIERATLSYEYNSKITFNGFCVAFMEQYRKRGNKETTNRYREYCLSLYGEYIGNLKMVNITSKQLQDVLNDLFEKGKAHNTIKGTHNAIKQLFKYATESQLLPLSPAENLFIPKQKMQLVEDIDAQIKQLYLEPEELKSFLNELDQHRNVLFRTMAYVIAFTGMRPGESLALKLNDVDFERKIIRITKTVDAKESKKGDFAITPPKTQNAVRIVDIDKIVVDKIRYLLEFKYLKDWTESEFIFADKSGIPPTIKTLNQFVKRIGIKAKVNKRIRTYTLRHTHISLLAEAGVDLQFIMNRVGHKDSKTTTQIYLHVTEGMRKNAQNLMHTRFTQLLNMQESNASE